MKKWHKYSKYLETGDWHCHTRYADGRNTVAEMCRQAEKNGLELIAFTEHVNMRLPFDFGRLLRDVERARKNYPELRILAGCEAKVLDARGSLDVSEDVLDRCDIVLGTFQSFPASGKKEMESALMNMLKNPCLDVWTHPISFFQRCPLCEKDAYKIIRLCIESDVLIENNLRPRYRSPRLIEACRRMGARIVTSSDAHGTEDLRVMEDRQPTASQRSARI